jgi:hypothetical protein
MRAGSRHWARSDEEKREERREKRGEERRGEESREMLLDNGPHGGRVGGYIGNP